MPSVCRAAHRPVGQVGRDAGGELTVLEHGDDTGTLTVRLTVHSGR